MKSDFSDFCLFFVSTILFFFFSRSAMGFVLIGSIFDCVICNVL